MQTVVSRLQEQQNGGFKYYHACDLPQRSDVLWVALTPPELHLVFFGPKSLGTRDFQLYLHLTYTI